MTDCALATAGLSWTGGLLFLGWGHSALRCGTSAAWTTPGPGLPGPRPARDHSDNIRSIHAFIEKRHMLIFYVQGRRRSTERVFVPRMCLTSIVITKYVHKPNAFYQLSYLQSILQIGLRDLLLEYVCILRRRATLQA